MTPREKAERAKQLLEDPLVRHVLEDLRMGLVRQLESSPIGDHETHHEVALMLQLLARFKPMLLHYSQQGEIDAHRAKQQTFVERIRQKL